MPLEATPEILEQISTLSELANTFDQAAVALGATSDEFGAFLASNPEARRRWSVGSVEAMNQLRVSLTKQALAGSTQAYKCLKEIHDEAATKKAAPVASTTTSTPEQKRIGRAWRFLGTNEAAGECGVNAKFVQNLIREGIAEETAGRVNPVPMKLGKGGEWTVQPGAVFDWTNARALQGISTRMPKGLRRPDGYDDVPVVSNPAPLAPVSFGNLDLDVETILKRVLAGGELTNEDKKILLALAESSRRNTDSEERRAAKFAREDVIKMLQSLREAYCLVVPATAPARATDLLRIIREQFQMDLSAKNSAAHQILTSAICEQSNRYDLPAIKAAWKNQLEEVDLLEGMA